MHSHPSSQALLGRGDEMNKTALALAIERGQELRQLEYSAVVLVRGRQLVVRTLRSGGWGLKSPRWNELRLEGWGGLTSWRGWRRRLLDQCAKERPAPVFPIPPSLFISALWWMSEVNWPLVNIREEVQFAWVLCFSRKVAAELVRHVLRSVLSKPSWLLLVYRVY